VVAIATLALVAGALAAPAVAKRKPKPSPAPVQAEQTFYLVQGAEGDPCARALRPTPSSTNHSECLDAGAGIVNETWSTYHGSECDPDANGATPRCVVEPASAEGGLPFRLDATRKLHGTIHVRSLNADDAVPAGVGVGPATFHLSARAVLDGTPTLLGRVTVDYVVTPAQTVYEIPFELPLDASLNGAEATAFGVELWNSGPTAGHGSYVPDVSTVVVPVWRRR
jgi:hypothetical protein